MTEVLAGIFALSCLACSVLACAGVLVLAKDNKRKAERITELEAVQLALARLFAAYANKTCGADALPQEYIDEARRRIARRRGQE